MKKTLNIENRNHMQRVRGSDQVAHIMYSSVSCSPASSRSGARARRNADYDLRVGLIYHSQATANMNLFKHYQKKMSCKLYKVDTLLLSFKFFLLFTPLILNFEHFELVESLILKI